MRRSPAISTRRKWRTEELSRNIHRIEITLDGVGSEQRVLLMSDVHWDNPHCDWNLLKRHLDEAKNYDAPVIDAGDWFCSMQGRFDPRSSKSDVRPEHQNARYLDSLVETAADWLKPYQGLLTVRGIGNHESSVLKRQETNLIARLVERMRTQGAEHIVAGGYSGFVVFNIAYGGTRRKPFKMYYHHGYGGGGPVTRGTIQTSRQAVYLADADLVLSGHTHDSWQMPIARVRLNADCTVIEHTRQTHIKVSGYKNEWADGSGGWHIERGGPPKPLGSAWVVFRQVSRDVIDYDVVEAK